MRSHYCGDINSSDIGSNIEISGWVTNEEIMVG